MIQLLRHGVDLYLLLAKSICFLQKYLVVVWVSTKILYLALRLLYFSCRQKKIMYFEVENENKS